MFNIKTTKRFIKRFNICSKRTWILWIIQQQLLTSIPTLQPCFGFCFCCSFVSFNNLIVIFGAQCIWGRIFDSYAKIFVFKYLKTIFHLCFMWNIYGKSVQELFWVHFFGYPYRSNGTKIHLDVVLIYPTYNHTSWFWADNL